MVYGILVNEFPAKYIVSIRSILMTANLNISLIGYGPVKIGSHPNDHDLIDIYMPTLPVNSKLKWAWAFKLENAVPTITKSHSIT